MTVHLHIYGKRDIWPQVLNTLRNRSGDDHDFATQLADQLASDSADSVRCIELPDCNDDSAHELALTLSSCVPDCCLRLSQLNDDTLSETLGLYHAGQRLAQRSVEWPKREGYSPRIVSTETELRFRLVVITEVPDHLEAILNEMAVQQESVRGEPMVLPVLLAIPDAEASWGRLPGFRPIFTMMIGDSGKLGTLHDSMASVRLPEPQALVFVEAILRPGTTVFEMECLAFGLPAAFVRDALQCRMGSWGQVYLSHSLRDRKHANADFVLVTLLQSFGKDATRESCWNDLYGLSGAVDKLLLPKETGQGGDSADVFAGLDDPYGWADLPETSLAQRLSGMGDADNWVAITRRVPVPRFRPEEALVDRFKMAAATLPSGVWLDVAYSGLEPWYQRFGSGIGREL